jgi:hypothetical protein
MKKFALVMIALLVSGATLFAAPSQQGGAAAPGIIRWAFWGE